MTTLNLCSGEELITKQNSIIKDLPTKGLKEFSPNKSWIEKKQIEKKLEEKFDFINTERIEKSNSLSVAEWIPSLGKAKVLKKIGKQWETIGHHQDNEDWLLPEEVLFLVENCELELILNNVSASIEECYDILLQDELCSFDEYRVYSYLCRAGLRVIRHSPSVTVTPYEQRINLDTILQKSKRSPPSTSSVKLDDNEVMIIDEINILCDSPEKETGDYSEKQSTSNNEVIEIEDDIDHNSIIEELLDSSDDSSDIICISSPSYTSTEHCQLWYPNIKQCLLRSMEKVIDLCSDDSPNDYKQLIHNKLDLIKFSKAEVLSLLPSAVNGVTVIHSPDSRLLPSNIVPKYSEYKVNLNIRSDYRVSNNFKPHYNPVSRMPLTNMSNSSHMNPELMTNPLFRKAEEMQAMAVSMIQTASTLMSALSSQNPNELWNFVDRRSQETRFHPRFRDFQQQRPYFRFPRRNFRPMRRRHPYEKIGERRFARRFNDFNNSYGVDLHSTKDFSSEIKVETVVLSDDDDTNIKKDSFTVELNNSKRKRMDCDITSKKLKTESDHDSLFLEEPNLKEKEKIIDISIESNDYEHSEMIVNKKDDIKEESCDLVDCIEIDEVVDSSQYEIDKKSSLRMPPTSEKNKESRNLEPKITLNSNKQNTTNSNNTFKNIELNEENNMQVANSEIQDSHNIATEQRNEQNVQESSCDSTDQASIGTDVELCKKNKLETISENNILIKNSCKEIVNITSSNLDNKITSWEEYKNADDSQLSVEEGDSETILRFEDCSNYGDVLNALQIFKAINLNKTRKKIKITYDVYLPGASFKKTLKVLPNFRVIILKSSEELPTPVDLQCLKTEYQDQIPFLFTIAFNETIGFYIYDTISLPPVFD
ncbi:unnamed protein product [Nezara viridula]|uniref:tRNA-splicing endonuclease subunit Sen54 N-terminal domain-containing protein n=1 Tax=Nezara viridula TaxID=85310 RepID=A0A9P0E5Z9_NEZVI|nr:unnamed protein product [Nezara viridula]